MSQLIASSLQRYLIQFSPLLASGVIGYLAIIYIFLWVDPTLIQHTWVSNSYAPLIVLSAFSHWCFFSYVLFHPRRGAIVSIILTALLFLQLQQVLTADMTRMFVFVGVVCESCFLLMTFGWHRWKLQRQRHRQAAPSPLTELPQVTSASENSAPAPQASRRRFRQRKHHFFGQ